MKTTWETKKLGAVLALITNGANCIQDKSGQGDKITRIETIAQAQIDFNRVGYCKLNKAAKLKYRLKRGDILFSHINSVTHVGKTAIFNSDEELYHGINLLLLRPQIFILPDYLQYFLKSLFLCQYWNSVCKQSINQASVNQQDIKKVDITYPNSTPEQKRIVKKLDEVFLNVAIAKVNVEKNLQNSKDFFESYLQSIFANPGKEWLKKRLVEIFLIKPPKNEAREKLQTNSLVSFVPMEDLGVNVKEFIPKKERELKDVQGSYTYFANEDVLLAKITPCFENGKLGVARNLKNEIGFGSSEYIVLRTNGEVVPDYLYYFLRRSQFRIEGIKKMSGAVGHKRVSKEFIEESILLYPKSLTEQKAIVKKLDALSTETKKLEKIYEQKLANLEELKKSILSKAFAGGL